MLSNRKKIAAVASLSVATAGLAAALGATSGASSAADIPALQRRAAVTISIVPGAIGPGSGTQSAAAAKWAVIGKYGAAKAGKKVALQRLSGTTWKTVDKSEIRKNGEVVFGVPGTKGVSYRVDGPGAASTPVTTDAWGTPLDFVDNFAGSRLNGTYWENRGREYQPESRRTCAKGSPKAVKVGGGIAKLSVIVDKSRTTLCKPPKPNNPKKIFGKFKWRLNANIGAKTSITYGVTAARIKFQPLQGQHASLWMQPAAGDGSRNPVTAGTEIDIIEWFGKDTPGGGLTSFIYAPSYAGTKIALGGNSGFIRNPEQYLTSEKDDWYKRYHVFSVEWNPQGYIFRIDGMETGRINKGVSAVAEYPILSLLSSDYELKKLGDEKNLPQTMSVDWIHTWQDPAHIPTTPVTPTPAP